MSGCETLSPSMSVTALPSMGPAPVLMEQIVYLPENRTSINEPVGNVSEREIQSYLNHLFPELSSVPYIRSLENSTLLTTGKHEARHMLVALKKNAHVSHVEINNDGTGVTYFSGNFSADDFYAIAAAGYQNDWEGGAADRWMIEQADGNVGIAESLANVDLQTIPNGYISIVGEMLAFLGNVDARTINAIVNRAKLEYEIKNNPGGDIGKQIESFAVNNGFYAQPVEMEEQPKIIITTDPQNQKYTAQYIVDGKVEILIEKCLICGCEGGAHDLWKHQTEKSLDTSTTDSAELIQPPVIIIGDTNTGVIFEEDEN